jgi:hypothetical protein
MALAHSEVGQHPATACHVHLDVKRTTRGLAVPGQGNGMFRPFTFAGFKMGNPAAPAFE